MLKKLTNKLSKLILTGIVLGVGVYGIAVKAPQIHGDWIRRSVGSQVVMITNETGNHGGTGFAVKAPSGQVLTLTNAHVCELFACNLYVRSDTSLPIPLQIIEVSKVSDLCLLSGIGRLSGLKLASGVDLGEELGLVGHPKLMPLTLSRGQLIGYANIAVQVSEEPCKTEEGMYKNVMSFFGPVCVEINRSALTTIPALGGNSGSPVVNVFGHVVGVLYAGDSRDNWGILIPLEAIQEMMKE